MFELLDEIIGDVKEELRELKFDRFSPLRFALKSFLKNLRSIDEAAVEGLDLPHTLKIELKTILREAEEQLGGLLRSDRCFKIKSEHRAKVTSLLARIKVYLEQLTPSCVPQSASFRISMFTRSNSFKNVEYEAPTAEVELKRISMKIERETITTSIEFDRPPNLSRKSAPPKPPPPPPSKTSRSRSKAKPEISRLPRVIKLFHSFRSRVYGNSSVTKTPNTSSKADPSAVIAELMSKSKHVQQINKEVEMHKAVVNKWTEEIKSAEFKSMDSVCSFVRKMDSNLESIFTDEVSALKKIGNWPRRYDILREASGSWTVLKEMQSKLLNWPEMELEEIQKGLETVMHRISYMSQFQKRDQDKFINASIPWESAIYNQIKEAVLKPLQIYLELVIERSISLRSPSQKTRLFSECATFAFKVHQFVGGFNEECTAAFSKVEAAAQSVIDQQLIQ